MSAWPSRVCSARRSAPPASRCVAKAWRRTCGLTRSGAIPASRGHGADDLEQPHPADMPGRGSGTDIAPRRQCRRPALDHRRRARGDRDQPLLVALAAQDQERLAGPERPARQRDQFGRAKPRPVEQFQQRQVAQRPRLVARRLVLGGAEHRASPRRCRGSAAAAAPAAAAPAQPPDCRREILLPGGNRKTAEAPPIAAPGSMRQARDQAGASAPNCSIDASPSDGTSAARRAQIAAIGRQGMARRPRFRRQHVEKSIDQPGVVSRHARASCRDNASAAIIRAANSCPLRLSAVIRWNW